MLSVGPDSNPRPTLCEDRSQWTWGCSPTQISFFHHGPGTVLEKKQRNKDSDKIICLKLPNLFRCQAIILHFFVPESGMCIIQVLKHVLWNLNAYFCVYLSSDIICRVRNRRHYGGEIIWKSGLWQTVVYPFSPPYKFFLSLFLSRKKKGAG